MCYFALKYLREKGYQNMDKHVAKAVVSGKFQIMIPKKIKEMMNIEEGDYVMFFEEGNRVYIDVGKLVLK